MAFFLINKTHLWLQVMVLCGLQFVFFVTLNHEKLDAFYRFRHFDVRVQRLQKENSDL